MNELLWRLRLWWSRLYIRKDEFHQSLSLDPFAYTEMNKEQRSKYLIDLASRRFIAHERDKAREIAGCNVLKKGG